MNNRLRELRKSRGLSQFELSKQAKISKQVISAIECGRYHPSMIMAFKIAHFFHVSIREVFPFEELSEE